MIGASLRSRWSRWSSGSLISRVLQGAGEAGIDVHVIARRSGGS